MRHVATRLATFMAAALGLVGIAGPARADTKYWWNISFTVTDGTHPIDAEFQLNNTGPDGVTAGNDTKSPLGTVTGTANSYPDANGDGNSYTQFALHWPNPMGGPPNSTNTLAFSIQDDSSTAPTLASPAYWTYAGGLKTQMITTGPDTNTTYNTPTPGPEASTWSIVGPGTLGMLGCAWRQRRNRRSVTPSGDPVK